MAAAPKALLHVNGRQFDLEALRRAGSAGPRIKVKQKELDSELNMKTVEASGEAAFIDEAILAPMPLFYKFEGKMLVLIVGSAHTARMTNPEQEIVGHLISSPMLKKFRVLSAAELEEQRQAEIQAERDARAAARPYLGNHPRFTDNRESRSPYPPKSSQYNTGRKKP